MPSPDVRWNSTGEQPPVPILSTSGEDDEDDQNDNDDDPDDDDDDVWD